MKNRDLIQKVQSIYSKGMESDDSRLEDRYIYFKMITLRSKILGEKINKKQALSNWCYQLLKCVPVIEVDSIECDCVPKTGEIFFRTAEPLPKPLESYDGLLINSITSLDGAKRYDETSWIDKRYKSGRRYTSLAPDYYFRNGYLYFSDSINPRKVAIEMILEEPLEALKYANCSSDCVDCEDCIDCTSYLDTVFPMSAKETEILLSLAEEDVMNRFNASIEDTRNNTADSPPQNTK